MSETVAVWVLRKGESDDAGDNIAVFGDIESAKRYASDHFGVRDWHPQFLGPDEVNLAVWESVVGFEYKSVMTIERIPYFTDCEEVPMESKSADGK